MTLIRIVAIGCTVAVVGFGAAQAEDVQVAIDNFTFNPPQVKVKAGTKVTWTNFDEILHTVTTGTPPTGPATFDGKLDGKGTSFAFTFDRPGVYKYFCQRHPEAMTGEVDVT